MTEVQTEGTLVVPKIFIETQHDDQIHDVQFDFYGRRLATCSADGKIKVFDCTDASGGVGALQSARLLTELQASTNGPVWQVSWAHPRFGTVLGSCSFDGRAIIWAEPEPPAWPGGARPRPGSGLHLQPIYEHRAHEPASVNAIAFAPPEYGLVFACASSDGRVSVCRRDEHDGSWRTDWVCEPASGVAHQLGVTCLSWAPSRLVGGKIDDGFAETEYQWSPMRLATGGCDHHVRLWVYDPVSETWRAENDSAHPDSGVLTGHTDWVRAVAWCPSRSVDDVLATAGQDRRVRVWRRVQTANEQSAFHQEGSLWSYVELPRFKAPCWGLSWSTTGLLLAVACGDQTVSIWKQALTGEWKQVAEATEAGAQAIRAREQASAEQMSNVATGTGATNPPSSARRTAPGGDTASYYPNTSSAISPGPQPGINPMVRPGSSTFHAAVVPGMAGMRSDTGASAAAFVPQMANAGPVQGLRVPGVATAATATGMTNIWSANNPAASGAPPANPYGPLSGMQNTAPVPLPPPSVSPSAARLRSPAYGSMGAPAVPSLPPLSAGMAAPPQSSVNAPPTQVPHQLLAPPPPPQRALTNVGMSHQAPASIRPPAFAPTSTSASTYHGGMPPSQAAPAYLRPNVPSSMNASYGSGGWNSSGTQGGPQGVAPPPLGPQGMPLAAGTVPGATGSRAGNLQVPPPPPPAPYR